jgi:hypothetical protein
MITPSLTLMIAGLDQVIIAIGPTRKRPSTIGKLSSRSRTMTSIR